MAKQLTFTELDSLLSKVNDKGSVITNNTFSKIDEWIDTGNYLLNAQLSGTLFGGYTNSRSICLAGESGTGKTFLTLNACREAQKMGYNIIYMDSEAAVDEDIVRNFGINPDTFRYQPVSTPQEVRHFVTNLCDTIKKAKGSEIPKIMLVLDSLGNLATNKERTDAISGSEKKDMTKQQELRSLFRVITTDLAEIKIPFIFTNHTYACALGDTPVLLANGEYKKLEEIKIGDIVLTIEGEKPVTNTFKYENTRTIKLHFENDVVIECSPLHKFLVGNDPKNPESWVTAEDLLEGNFVMQLNDIDPSI
jgi:archaellum biogenesis ATPase FlaH